MVRDVARSPARRSRPRCGFAMPTARGWSSRPSRRTCSTTRPSAASSSTIATSPARKSLEDELKRQAFHDSLTGLANRALFADRLEHAISRAERVADGAGGALRRSRRLQDRQRQPRPRRGRPAPGRGRGPAPSRPPGRRHDRPDGRRRVRRSSSRTRPTARRRSTSAGGCSPRSSRRSSTAARSCSSGRASGSPIDARPRSHRRRAPPERRRRDVHGEDATARTGSRSSSRACTPPRSTRLALKGDLERALERDEFRSSTSPSSRLGERPPLGRRGAPALAAPRSRDRRRRPSSSRSRRRPA